MGGCDKKNGRGVSIRSPSYLRDKAFRTSGRRNTRGILIAEIQHGSRELEGSPVVRYCYLKSIFVNFTNPSLLIDRSSERSEKRSFPDRFARISIVRHRHVFFFFPNSRILSGQAPKHNSNNFSHGNLVPEFRSYDLTSFSCESRNVTCLCLPRSQSLVISLSSRFQRRERAVPRS